MRSKSSIINFCLDVILLSYLVIAVVLLISCSSLKFNSMNVVHAMTDVEENSTCERTDDFYKRYDSNLSKASIYVGDYTKIAETEVENRVTICDVWFRSEGFMGASPYSIIHGNTTVTKIGDVVNGWCPVEYDGKTGWIHNSLLN